MSEKIVTIAGESTELLIEKKGTAFRARERELELLAIRGTEAEIRTGGRTHVVPFAIDGTTVHFAFDGEIYAAEVTEKGARTKARHRDQSMSAPMPGVVLKILVAPGDVVAKGAPLVVLEAMKMEHQIVASRDGKIDAIHCKEGELVQPGVELVTMSDAN
jgi:3-methylcrotonyl-CoA carboxylase alpha subunit